MKSYKWKLEKETLFPLFFFFKLFGNVTKSKRFGQILRYNFYLDKSNLKIGIFSKKLKQMLIIHFSKIKNFSIRSGSRSVRLLSVISINYITNFLVYPSH